MQYPSVKIVKVHVIETSLQTVEGKSLVIPESKDKYDIEKIVELMKHQVPFVDKSILAILIRTFNKKVIELASEGFHIDTELVYLKTGNNWHRTCRPDHTQRQQVEGCCHAL